MLIGCAVLWNLHCGLINTGLSREIFLTSGDVTDRPEVPVEEFVQHSERVYSYRLRFYRALLVRGNSGWIVIDPMNPRVAAGLLTRLGRDFPGVPVHTLIYSHYHHDHTGGGALLKARDVLAHRNCARYWQDFGPPEDFAAPTRWLAGDQNLRIDGVQLRLLDLGHSHTDTIFAIVLPGDDVLYSPDVGFARAWPVPGPFDTYYAGYVRAMERLLATGDWSQWVPAHGVPGTRADLAASLEMFVFLRTSMAVARKKYPEETRADLEKIFDEVWPQWQQRYGHLPGFDELALANLLRQLSGYDLAF